MKLYQTGQLRNVVILSHEGAGKTTLVESLLFASGAIARIGNVADGTTTSDYDPEEVKHKISLATSIIPIEWQDHKINILDTPGYADFVGDALAAVRAADVALIVVCASNGVEVGTETAWTMADQHLLPRLLVVNRLDRENTSFASVLSSLHDTLSAHAVAVHWPIGEGVTFQGYVDLLANTAYTVRGSTRTACPIPLDLASLVRERREALIEAIAETDDDLINHYLEGEELGEQSLRDALRRAIASRQIFPVMCVSALTNTNTTALLDALLQLAPSPLEATEPRDDDGQPLAGRAAAIVFKTVADPFGKLSYLRVFSGTIRADNYLFNATRSKDERIGQLLYVRGKNQETTPELVTGDIGAALKLPEALTGDTLCQREQPLRLAALSYPLTSFTAAVEPKTRADLDKLGAALTRLMQEDPTLQVTRDAHTGQMLLGGLGESHLAVAVERLHRKSQVDVTLSEPRIPYRETITATAREQGRFKRQTGGHGQFGDVSMEISPQPHGAGFEFVDNIVGGAIPRNYIPAVEKGVQEALVEGFLAGYPIVDVRVRIYDGSFHAVDSSEMAFKIAGSMAFKKCMEKAHPILLEPIMEVEVDVPEPAMGDVIGDLTSKRGRILGMDAGNQNMQHITAQVPLSEMGHYGTTLRSLTQGRAVYQMRMIGYDEVPAHLVPAIAANYQSHSDHTKEHH